MTPGTARASGTRPSGDDADGSFAAKGQHLLCCQQCLSYNQTAKGANDSLLSKLKNVDDRYTYEAMELPASYDVMSTLAEIIGVCIFICKFDSDGKIRLGQQGRLEHLTQNLMYLLKKKPLAITIIYLHQEY